MDKLKPCPFCGGEVVIDVEWADAISEYYNFSCVNCCMVTYNDECVSKQEATEAWNRRTEDEELRFTRNFIVDHGLLYELLNAFEERKKADNAGNEMR